MSPSLSVVSADGKVAALERTNSNDAVVERVRRLQAEARGLVLEHVRDLEAALHTVERLSREIAGVREIARRLTEDAETKAQTLEAIMAKA